MYEPCFLLLSVPKNMIQAIFFLLIGVVLGYAVFYFRYQDSKSIDEMRDALMRSKQKIHDLELEFEEIMDQNRILKHKGQFLLDQNDDYSKIISEHSRIIHLIKKAYEQSRELNKTLSGYDQSIEDKLLKASDMIANTLPESYIIPVYDQEEKIF